MGNNPEPGIYDTITFDEYMAIPYFHKSFVGSILRSPKALKYDIDNPEDLQKRQVDFGSLVDCLLLERSVFASKFEVLPDICVDSRGRTVEFSARTKDGRRIVNEILAEGKTPIAPDDLQRAEAAVGAIRAHPMASQWIRGKPQITIVWKDPETGIYCKGRLDLYLEGEREIDLKMTFDPMPGAFARTANAMKYHVQGAMYLMGLYCQETGKYPQDWNMPFSFIACEDKPPYDVICYDLDQDSLDAGKILFQEAIQKYADCVAADTWPGYSDFAEPLTIPAWALNRIQLEGVFSE